MTSEKEVLIIGQVTFMIGGLIVLISGMKNDFLSPFAKWLLIIAIITTIYSTVLGLRNSKNSTFYLSKIVQLISTIIISVVIFVAPIVGMKFIDVPVDSILSPVIWLLLIGAAIIIIIPFLRLKGKEIFD